MTEVKESTHGLDKVRATFVCYRDFADQKPFEIKDFTEDVDAVLEFIDNVEAEGGADTPEDVAGALRKVLDQPWGGANAYK